MSVAGTQLNSLRWSGPEGRRLALVLALSLTAHLLTWGGYEAGKDFGWWRVWHWPVWLRVLTEKLNSMPVREVHQESPLEFVMAQQPATEPPTQDTKYFSTQNSRAANPDADKDTDKPKLDGKQTDVPMTLDVPRPVFNQTPPTPAAKPAAPPELSMNTGDLTLGKPPLQPSPKPAERPRTVNEARALLARQVPGVAMRQDGGVRNHARQPSLDVKVTGFAEYDQRFIEAVSQRWYDLLDSQQFALDRTGKVTLRFHLNYDGSISEMRFAENTVGDLLGYVCQKAVLDSEPFERFPSDMRAKLGNFADVQFTFYYY
jgi:outer membrane biosynthesis protein TonB